MNPPAGFLALVHEQLHFYENHARALGGQEASRRNDLAFEVVLSLGVNTARLIDQADMAWTMKVETGVMVHDPATITTIEDLYQRWFQVSRTLLEQMHTLQRQGERVLGGDRFRQVCGEVEQLLADAYTWVDDSPSPSLSSATDATDIRLHQVTLTASDRECTTSAGYCHPDVAHPSRTTSRFSRNTPSKSTKQVKGKP